MAATGLPWLKGRRWWLSIPIALVLVALPLLLWQDYLRSIYRSMTFVGQNQLDRPVLVYLEIFRRTAADVVKPDAGILPLLKLCVIVSLTAQTAYLLYRRSYESPWWRVSVMFALLMLTVHKVVWDGYPGAVTRVTLPLVFGFNVLLSREPGRGFWLWYAIGNLQLVAGAYMLPF
jgi:hypothetical protein